MVETRIAQKSCDALLCYIYGILCLSYLGLILGVIVSAVLLLEELHVNLAEAGEWHIVNEDYTTWLCTILDVHLTVVQDGLANLCVLAGIVATLNDNQWVMADAVYTVLA